MRRPLTPVWLAHPSRYALLSPGSAQICAAIVGALLMITLIGLSAPQGATDTGLYLTIVEGVRHGGYYYTVAGDALRAGGYPVTPFVAVRLPTLTMIAAAVPPFALLATAYALVIGVAVAWYARLKPALKTRPARAALAVTLFFGLAPLLQPAIIVLPEMWAGLFLALSLAQRRPGRWIEAVAFGFAAAVIRETALAYVLVMALFAWRERAGREAVAWVAAFAVAGAVLALHAQAAAALVTPLDSAIVDWTGYLGIGFFLRALVDATGLAVLPLAIAAPIAGAALFGWTAWRDPLANRVLALLILLGIAMAMFGTADTAQWSLLASPMLLPALVFLPDALRDLVGAMSDRRRITVTRIIR